MKTAIVSSTLLAFAPVLAQAQQLSSNRSADGAVPPGSLECRRLVPTGSNIARKICLAPVLWHQIDQDRERADRVAKGGRI